MKRIALLSGGKDSVTMCDLMLKNNMNIDYIIFTDTLDEFEEMYIYIEKLKVYFKRKYNKDIIVLKPARTYEDYIFRKRIRGENKGRISGLPNPTAPFCEWRRDTKIIPLQKWLKKNNIWNYEIFLGFTTDEKKRANNIADFYQSGKPKFPLIELFKYNEQNCREYLKNNELENPLYQHFNRTGCQKCQYQSIESWFKIWKYYPQIWSEVIELEKKVKDSKTEAISYHFFKDYQTTSDLELLFKKKDKQNSLFEFNDEPIKDCFCKI